MRLIHISALLAVSLLSGCYAQTNISRKVTRADGSTDTYENHSNGYNYNPNYTGTQDMVYESRINGVAVNNAFSSTQLTLPPQYPNGWQGQQSSPWATQHTIK